MCRSIFRVTTNYASKSKYHLKGSLLLSDSLIISDPGLGVKFTQSQRPLMSFQIAKTRSFVLILGTNISHCLFYLKL